MKSKNWLKCLYLCVCVCVSHFRKLKAIFCLFALPNIKSNFKSLRRINRLRSFSNIKWRYFVDWISDILGFYLFGRNWKRYKMICCLCVLDKVLSSPQSSLRCFNFAFEANKFLLMKNIYIYIFGILYCPPHNKRISCGAQFHTKCTVDSRWERVTDFCYCY